MNERYLSSRIGAIAGIMGSVLFSLMWLLAAILDIQWSFGRQTLSELGGQGRSGAFFFNLGVIMEAFLALVFALGLYLSLNKGVLSRLGIVTLILACFALLGVGIFPISAGLPHTYASYAFFGLALISAVLLIRPIWTSYVFGRLAGIVTFFAIAIPLLFFITSSIPLTEAVAVISLLIWTFVLSVKMLAHHPTPYPRY